MAFCVKCGEQLNDGVKFCAKCGTPVAGAAQAAPPPPEETAPRPRTVTVGQVKKCPNCGQPIESFQTRCSACGYELQNKEIAASVKEFTSRIEQLDNESPAIKRGSRLPIAFAIGFGVCLAIGAGSYGGTMALFLVFMFICMVMCPISILFSKPRMTDQEKQKKAMVESFVVPNTRQDLLEFFTFAVSQVESGVVSGAALKAGSLVSSEKKYRIMWDKIWRQKCKQTYAKANLALDDKDKDVLASIAKTMRTVGL
jgi:ribosomal protein L37E